jgi:hypothetical protein
MPDKRFDAIGIGACNLDTVAFVKKFTECEEKINAFDYMAPKAAGVALDAITMLTYLGMRCGFIGKRGDDYLGKVFDEEMNADRIDLASAMTVSGERTSLAWIQVKEDGERCYVIIPMSEKGKLRAVEICRETGTPVSVDLDVAPLLPLSVRVCDRKRARHPPAAGRHPQGLQKRRPEPLETLGHGESRARHPRSRPPGGGDHRGRKGVRGRIPGKRDGEERDPVARYTRVRHGARLHRLGRQGHNGGRRRLSGRVPLRCPQGMGG